MADPSALRRLPLVATGLVVALALALSGCGGDDDDAAGDPPSTTISSPDAPDTTVDTEAFCAEMERLDVEQPEAYVGSDEHVADIEALIEVSPDEIRPAVERYRDFLTSGQITDDLESTQTDSWPEDVQADLAALEEYATSAC
ncbi:MAG TPA: hypothetical protein VK507_17325 [Iamia sp.]|nr:hypothetical protein [Iamia sp.]